MFQFNSLNGIIYTKQWITERKEMYVTFCLTKEKSNINIKTNVFLFLIFIK